MGDRTGTGNVRHHFRTREGEGEDQLPTGMCSACAGETYRVPEGTWLHWSTLTAECPRQGRGIPVEPELEHDGKAFKSFRQFKRDRAVAKSALERASDGQEGGGL